MAMPASGAINFSLIQTEFGGANPINFNEYYRGGAYVPNISQNNSIPTSGQISASQFYNAYARLTSALTLTVGYQSVLYVKTYHNEYGYDTVGRTLGSLSPSTYSSIHGTLTVQRCYHTTFTGQVIFRVNSSTNADTVFYEIVVNGTTYTRASATFTDIGGGVGQWAWTVANPFPTSGNITLTVRRYG